MVDFIAVKKLAPSDLTFFEKLYRAKRKSGQKCITLNADVFIKQFYPGLEAIAATVAGEVKIGLTVFGPGGAGAYPLTRKITKGKRRPRNDGAAQKPYKNWRLNGEFIYDPENEPGRFDSLVDYDVAVIGFEGAASPTNVTLILLAHSLPFDQAISDRLSPLLISRRESMKAISAQDIYEVLQSTNTPLSHPLWVLAGSRDLEAAFEDAALGGDAGREILRQRRQARPVSQVELDRALEKARYTGVQGEILIDEYLSQLADIKSHIWASEQNAIAPFDFVAESDGGDFRIDVKSTTGEFDTAFHISFGELFAARESAIPYHIYRIYSLTDDGAKLRVSQDIREFSSAILSSHESAFPVDVKADSFSIRTSALTWATEIVLTTSPEDADLDD